PAARHRPPPSGGGRGPAGRHARSALPPAGTPRPAQRRLTARCPANGRFTGLRHDGPPRNEEPSMRLHRILPALLGLLLATPAVQAEPWVEGRRISVDSADARAFIQERFPQRHSTLGGLLQLTVSNPGLELPPGARMHLGLDLAAATAGGASTPVGRVLLSSALPAPGWNWTPAPADCSTPGWPTTRAASRCTGLSHRWPPCWAASRSNRPGCRMAGCTCCWTATRCSRPASDRAQRLGWSMVPVHLGDPQRQAQIFFSRAVCRSARVMP